ncbi:hypothetical protein, partial [Klebsiella pneumoniae]|uniref:hypothetical protein n=1 Tax=Klebsiella pneumoniae TaxID=573 RepID=UPI0039C183B5
MEEIQVKDEALDSLSGLIQLKYLSFKSNFLTDVSLYQFSSIPNLTSLSIRDAVLTNTGLDFFNP